MTIKRCAAVLLVLALSATLSAQSAPTASPAPATRPDFSGTWVHVSSTSTVGPGGGGAFNLGMEFTVAQDDKTITVQANPALGGPRKFIYNLDGSVSQNDRDASKITWDGAKLVIATAGSPSRTQIWSLDRLTSQLTVETTLDIPGSTIGPIITTGVYTKK